MKPGPAHITKPVFAMVFMTISIFVCASGPVIADNAAFVIVSNLIISDDGDATDKELQKIRQEMDSEKRELTRIMKKRGGLFEKIAALKDQLKKSEERFERLETEKLIATEDKKDLHSSMQMLLTTLDEKREQMGGRLRARYFFAKKGEFRVWLEAGSMSELSRRKKYLEAIYLADRAKINDYKDLLAQWSSVKTRLTQESKRLTGLESIAAEQKLRLESEKQTLTSMLIKLEKEKKKHETKIAGLKADASRLQSIIAGLDVENNENPDVHDGGPVETDDGGFRKNKGRLCYPASGAVLSGFGKKVHPEFNTVIMQNGIEIGAGRGAQVKAVYEGTVRFAKWFRGYGNMVIVDHDGGYYTIYAHLDQINASVGQAVGRGSSIGTVGDTGSISGASLYFEIRHHKKPLNPAGWLAGCSL